MPRIYPQRALLWTLYVCVTLIGCKLLISTLSDYVPGPEHQGHVERNKRETKNDGSRPLPPTDDKSKLPKPVPSPSPKLLIPAKVPIRTPMKQEKVGGKEEENDPEDNSKSLDENNPDVPEENAAQNGGGFVPFPKFANEITEPPDENEDDPDDSKQYNRRLKSSKNSAQKLPEDNPNPLGLPEIQGLNEYDKLQYPQKSLEGKFIPLRRMVHFDLKGAPPKLEYFKQIFPVIKKLGGTSLLLEWEDMFPYTGKLASAVNLKPYTTEDIQAILHAATDAKLEIVPLVQTFGHLEWILKLKEFAHLRENPKIPQVICFGKQEGWDLIKDMIDQVIEAHKPFGIPFFHIGADEAFQVGLCDEDRELMMKEGGKQKLILWHVARTAEYIRRKHGIRVLAWHDMFANAPEQHLRQCKMVDLVEPVIWNYAEDLNHYLPPVTWTKLKVFPYLWTASAYKGADGPSRWYSNPKHYIANHRSWMIQMNNHYAPFKQLRGIILTGWSRYDHMAILCEIPPVGNPSLFYNLMIVNGLEGKYGKLQEEFGCQMQPDRPQLHGCRFPGAAIYELVQQIKTIEDQLNRMTKDNHEFHGWLSKSAVRFKFSSGWYLSHLIGNVNNYLSQYLRAKSGLKQEMSQFFYKDAVNELIFQLIEPNLNWLNELKETADLIIEKKEFPKRPFPEFMVDDTGDRDKSSQRKRQR